MDGEALHIEDLRQREGQPFRRTHLLSGPASGSSSAFHTTVQGVSTQLCGRVWDISEDRSFGHTCPSPASAAGSALHALPAGQYFLITDREYVQSTQRCCVLRRGVWSVTFRRKGLSLDKEIPKFTWGRSQGLSVGERLDARGKGRST